MRPPKRPDQVAAEAEEYGISTNDCLSLVFKQFGVDGDETRVCASAKRGDKVRGKCYSLCDISRYAMDACTQHKADHDRLYAMLNGIVPLHKEVARLAFSSACADSCNNQKK